MTTKLTKTQINAVVARLKKKAMDAVDGRCAKAGQARFAEERRRDAANREHVKSVISASNLSTEVKAFLTSKDVLDSIADIDNWSGDDVTFPGLPYTTTQQDEMQELRGKINDAVSEMEFELVMAGVEGYRMVMATYEAKIMALVR